MGKVLMTGAGGGSSSSDDCTASANDILKGKTAVYNGSDDDIGTGTLELTGSATDGYVYSGKTYYNTDAHTIRTGSMTVGSILNFSAAVYSGRQILLKWQNPYAATGRPFGGVFVNYSTSGYPGTGGTRIYTGYGNNTASGGWAQVIVTLPNLSTTYYFSCTAYVSCSAGDMWGNTLNASCATANSFNLTFKSSQDYTIPAGYSYVDIFCVGGGGAGGIGRVSGSRQSGGGGGGGGGYTATASNISVSSGQVLNCSVGAGGTASSGTVSGSGGASTVYRNGSLLCSANGGVGGYGGYGGGNGGSGGGAGGYGDSRSGQGSENAGNGGSNGGNGSNTAENTNYGGTGQGTSTYGFNGTLYSGGGGGGATTGATIPGSGGSGGGGGGGNAVDTGGYGYAGSANTGGGGGGGGSKLSLSSPTYQGGNGGSGIIIIRVK